MTIDEAIKLCEDDAEKIGGNPQSDRHASNCRQLAEWLSELKEAKRLLKLALNDFETIELNLEYGEHCVIKTHSIRCDECPLSAQTVYRCKWRYADEALKLIRND